MTWWVCAGCGTAVRMDKIGIPQCPCECGDERWTQTTKADALSNNPTVCDDYISDEKLSELSQQAEEV